MAHNLSLECDGLGGASVLERKLEVMIMSGVDDGMRLTFSADSGEGQVSSDGRRWTVSIGRVDENDICLKNDTFVSRQHGFIVWEDNRWWLQDCDSTNGTFLDSDDGEARVTGTIPINPGVMFRIGHTWMRIQAIE
jgi:pSer/pThr/pTyr-binding forkhead associated (FHA) protein